jgi:hypothetical protein
MEIFMHLDKFAIFQKLLLIFFILFYYMFTKIAFISLLVQFEETIGIRVKNKFFFFILSFLFTVIGSSIFSFFLLFLLPLSFEDTELLLNNDFEFLVNNEDFEFLVNNLNFVFALNIFTILYCFKQLLWYTTFGSLSVVSFFGEQILEKKQKLMLLKKPND